MRHPFQCLASQAILGQDAFLVAAAGHRIYSYGLVDGLQKSIWPPEGPEQATEILDPPTKKRKANDDALQGNGNSDAPNDEEHDKTTFNAGKPKFIKVEMTRDAKHVIAVTAEDKCVRVFSMNNDGTLVLLSARLDAFSRMI